MRPRKHMVGRSNGQRKLAAIILLASFTIVCVAFYVRNLYRRWALTPLVLETGTSYHQPLRYGGDHASAPVALPRELKPDQPVRSRTWGIRPGLEAVQKLGHPVTTAGPPGSVSAGDPSASLPRCPSHTVPHPALSAMTPDPGSGSEAAHSHRGQVLAMADSLPVLPPAMRPGMVKSLAAFGLHPMTHAAVPVSANVPNASPAQLHWRGTGVPVRHSKADTSAEPAMRARPARGSQNVRARVEKHISCLNLPGPKGPASKVISGGYVALQQQNASSVITDVYPLLVHGLRIRKAVRAFLDDIRDKWAVHSDAQVGTPWHAGPWVEDYWLATFQQPIVLSLPPEQAQGLLSVSNDVSLAATPSSDPSLVDVVVPYDPHLFHPWVPLFIPWTAITTNLNAILPQYKPWLPINLLCEFAKLLYSVMQPRYQYVTLSERAEGPWIIPFSFSDECSTTLFEVLQTTLVISSGGIGHVPIPLMAAELPFLGCSADPGTALHQYVFVGSLDGRGSRDLILEAMQRKDVGATHLLARTPEELRLPGSPFMTNTSSDMMKSTAHLLAMGTGAYQLAPRGTGPTSFRLYEALQMGLVPVYVYDGQPWLPYEKEWQDVSDTASFWARIAYVVPARDLPAWIASRLQAARLDPRAVVEEHARMRLAAAALRADYFTYDGVLRRVAEWLDDPGSARLACYGSSFL